MFKTIEQGVFWVKFGKKDKSQMHWYRNTQRTQLRETIFCVCVCMCVCVCVCGGGGGGGGGVLCRNSPMTKAHIKIYAFRNMTLHLAYYSQRIANTNGEKLECWNGNLLNIASFFNLFVSL